MQGITLEDIKRTNDMVIKLYGERPKPKCEDCQEEVSRNEESYCHVFYPRHLYCMRCQKNHKKEKTNKVYITKSYKVLSTN